MTSFLDKNFFSRCQLHHNGGLKLLECFFISVLLHSFKMHPEALHLPGKEMNKRGQNYSISSQTILVLLTNRSAKSSVVDRGLSTNQICAIVLFRFNFYFFECLHYVDRVLLVGYFDYTVNKAGATIANLCHLRLLIQIS